MKDQDPLLLLTIIIFGQVLQYNINYLITSDLNKETSSLLTRKVFLKKKALNIVITHINSSIHDYITFYFIPILLPSINRNGDKMEGMAYCLPSG